MSRQGCFVLPSLLLQCFSSWLKAMGAADSKAFPCQSEMRKESKTDEFCFYFPCNRPTLRYYYEQLPFEYITTTLLFSWCLQVQTSQVWHTISLRSLNICKPSRIHARLSAFQNMAIAFMHFHRTLKPLARTESNLWSKREVHCRGNKKHTAQLSCKSWFCFSDARKRFFIFQSRMAEECYMSQHR